MEKKGYVYILTNQTNTVLYIGVTSVLIKRIDQHKTKAVEGFSYKYNLTKLVYYEMLNNIQLAIEREKKLKGWLRQKKIDLINEQNPNWQDLYNNIT